MRRRVNAPGLASRERDLLSLLVVLPPGIGLGEGRRIRGI
jgi:hypothetical protein